MTKTFRDNCDTVPILCSKQAASFFFSMFQMQLKKYFFVSIAFPCMQHNCGIISGSHACRDCVWHIILDAKSYRLQPALESKC